MTRLSFLSPGAPSLRIREVRGAIPEGAIPIGRNRALVVGDVTLGPEVDRVYDMSAALVAIDVENEALLRRITELDAFPAVGSILRGVRAVIEHHGNGFRLFVPQEFSEFVREAIDDLRSGT